MKKCLQTALNVAWTSINFWWKLKLRPSKPSTWIENSRLFKEKWEHRTKLCSSLTRGQIVRPGGPKLFANAHHNHSLELFSTSSGLPVLLLNIRKNQEDSPISLKWCAIRFCWLPLWHERLPTTRPCHSAIWQVAHRPTLILNVIILLWDTEFTPIVSSEKAVIY